MTNEVAATGKIITGTVVSLTSAGVSWLPQIEAFLRMGASLIAIASGGLVIWFAVADRRRVKSPIKRDRLDQQNKEDENNK